MDVLNRFQAYQPILLVPGTSINSMKYVIHYEGGVKIVNIVIIANIASPAHLLCTFLILLYHEASLRREQRLRDGEN